MIMIAPHWKLSVAVALFFSVFPVVILGQTSTANIDGRVVDPTGAAIPGATVTAVHAETGATRLCTASVEGSYVFASLPIGTYDLSVQQVGFKKALKTGIILHVNDRLSLDMALEIGDLAQEVSVTANRDQVQTETSEQSGLITGDQVRELQLNGRSFVTLLELVPGVEETAKSLCRG